MRDNFHIAQTWYTHVTDPALKSELETLLKPENEEQLLDAFYQDLEFGTAGMRGTLGVGTNRMNVHTVGVAAQGFAKYLCDTYEHPKVVIARDSRNKGDVFERICAQVLAAHGIRVYIFPRIEPVPVLSFAVRYLKAQGGIALTASHNPAAYNGFKAYNDQGCQITEVAAAQVSNHIAQIDMFGDVKLMDFEQALNEGKIEWISDAVIEAYCDAVCTQSLTSNDLNEQVTVLYTPLHGAGYECVTKVLKRIGVKNLHEVSEQCVPNGDFPTCPYPNPEVRQALELGLQKAKEIKPSILFATDPDSDRLGVAVNQEGDFVLLSGNETGALLMDWISKIKKEAGENLSDYVGITTIVSSALCESLARAYGFELRRTLTGFKYIGEQIDDLQAHGKKFLMGFEESYGYLVGDHARDKDAVVAAMLVCEMTAWYKQKDMTLVDALNDLYNEHGFYLNKVITIDYPGSAGATQMKEIMDALHGEKLEQLGRLKVEKTVDYLEDTPMSIENGTTVPGLLPKSNVLELQLEGGAKVIVRPSGTEPKIKAYLFACAPTKEEAENTLEYLAEQTQALLKK